MASYKKEVSYKDIPTILLESRIINLVGEVNERMAYDVVSMLQILNEDSKTKPIQLLINSPGGSCVDGYAIIDMMNYIDAPVYTICTGMAASMGAAILSAGEPGHRAALPNATIMVHQASTGHHMSNIQDLRVSMKRTEELNERLAKMIAANCGLSYEEYLEKTIRDYYMWPENATPGKFGEKGIIDMVITKIK